MNKREAKRRALNIAVLALKKVSVEILDHIDDDTTDEEGKKIGDELDKVIERLTQRADSLS